MNTRVSEADLIGGTGIVLSRADAKILADAFDAAATLYLWVSGYDIGVAPEDMDAIDQALRAACEVVERWEAAS